MLIFSMNEKPDPEMSKSEPLNASVKSKSQSSGLTPLAEPWIGPVSRLEVFGFGAIAFLTLFYLMRLRKK